ncbi:hypothetical protein PoB_004436900 [Plakobranchus ocellatus]|uniref:Uncharacterized protein n=1 Tax=Plakobranchus ocellatus TaxID=259542 RepID=A0AAV4BHQ9_9GAST|nr:hypothetical protein PoB_004436900 [Plakobranchus ocellatus]
MPQRSDCCEITYHSAAVVSGACPVRPTEMAAAETKTHLKALKRKHDCEITLPNPKRRKNSVERASSGHASSVSNLKERC